ncbi:copper uptake system-associated protein [Polynucleobacter sp. MG-Unter2-18]|uniref:copper uptake system-associated protein n=1 Tax=Polynucleobacter sp. MG-Unter2-18 TaxID=2081052 RepID=UPI001BFEB3E0|nr:copper uptake system-associated protein [Polynucleobacter sp. MG-Unter2-18]QWD95130.1 copper uptake system-associated protein [Polynucleobacter sp. MG-Unter2-18]
MFSIQMNWPFLRHISLFICAAICIASNAVAHPQTDAESQEKIKALISKTFDQPNLKVQITPIVIEGKVAIADWTQGQKGGRALLRRKHADWEIIACGGAGFKDPNAIAAAGISKRIAQNITAKLRTAEASLSAQKIKQLDSFDGVVTMGHGMQHGSDSKH